MVLRTLLEHELREILEKTTLEIKIYYLWNTEACKSQTSHEVTPKILKAVASSPLKHGKQALSC